MTHAPRRRRLSAVLLLTSLAAAAACVPGADGSGGVARSLDLSNEGAASGRDRPFKVVFASPRGPTTDPSEVTIVFSRPMRPLELAGDESAPPARIAVRGTGAAPAGSWRWVGTSALVFAPDPALPRATEYEVVVPAEVRALDGTTLSAPYRFSFATPRPNVESISPGDGSTHLLPNATFDVRFNQPVAPAEVERALVVSVAGRKEALRFRATRPDAANPKLVNVAPIAPLPLGASIALTFDDKLRGIEGPLTSGAESAVTVKTYGPIQVEQVTCSRPERDAPCSPGSNVGFQLSNRVSYRELAAHVRIEPPLKMAPAGTGDDDKSPWHSLPVALRAARSYRVTVTAGMKDDFGQVLPRDASFTLAVGDFAPQAEIGVEGDVFDAAPGKRRDIPISTMNLDSLELLTVPLDETRLAALIADESKGPRERYFDLGRKLPGHSLTSVRPGAPRNVGAVKTVSLDTVVGPKGRGVALVGIRHDGRGGRIVDEARILSLTDLGVTAKMSRFGSLVWVTHLGDGKPVAGATVGIYDRNGARFTTQTDAGGVATIPEDRFVPVDKDGNPDPATLVVARAGDDWAFRRVSEMLGPWRYGVSIDPSGRLSPVGMSFTDRGVYRPGETVRAKVIFRRATPKGMETPSGRDVSLTALDGNGDAFFKATQKLDAFGELGVDVPVPLAAHLGSAELRAEIAEPAAEGVNRTTSATFELAAYRASEFKVAVDPDKGAYVRGDKASFAVHGDYLFGAPMTNAKLHVSVTRGPGYFMPPKTDGLTIDDDTYRRDLRDESPRGGLLHGADGALDAKGTFADAISLAMPNQHQTEVLNIEGEVQDVSRQSVAGRASVIVHPAEFYVAMKPPAELFVNRGASVAAEVVAVEPGGAIRAGVPIKLELLRRSWNTVLEASGSVGAHYVSKLVDKKLGECTITSRAALSGCALVASEPGYLVVRASAKDPRGNEIAASRPLYAIGGGDVGWQATDSTKLDLVADKKSYEIGDTAKILVKSPFKDAEALVTVERSGVFQKERVKLAGATPTVSIPITSDMRPNAFVSVHLVRGRTKAPPPEPTQAAPRAGLQDVGAPAFRLGYTELLVNPEARRLKVGITPQKKDFRPGEQVVADLSVVDRAGKGAKAEITFYAVDEGVLMLTGYKTPDPIPVFTEPRPLNVFALESRASLAKVFLTQLAGSAADKGDQGGGGAGAARSDFRATAHFVPSIITGADGKAQVSFKLPDNLTTFRLMAVVAAEDDRFGFGETQITTSRPLMARPALPRFLRAGDAMDAGIVLSSKGMAEAQVDVTVTAPGARIGGDAHRVVTLPANGTMEVRWPIATPDVGKVVFGFKVRAGSEGDEVLVAREVSPALSMETAALYGETESAVREKLGDLKAIRGDVGELDVRVASTALVGLGEAAEQLLEYPYGCTEQLVSRLVPLVPLRALAQEFHVKLPDNVDRAADDAVAKILANQRSDGGFGWWQDSTQSSTWISAYALWGLDVAKKHGRHVPDGALKEATRYVREALKKPDVTLGLAAKAFIVDVLATVGSPDAGYASTLFARRAEMPLFARALLAHAMVVGKTDGAAKPEAEELLRDVEGHLRITTNGATVAENLGDGYATLLDSEARTTAMVLRALAATNREHPLLGRLARGLLEMRHGGKFASTQDAAWSLLALHDYRKAAEPAAPSFDAVALMNDQPLFRAPFHDRTTIERTQAIPIAALLKAPGAGGLTFQVDGSGKLFYEARLRYSRKELPTTPLDRGFFVKKIMRSVAPDGLEAALSMLPRQSVVEAKGGDLVLIDVLVVSPDPHEQVVIDDPLPAGLEAVQASFQTSGQASQLVEPGGEADEGDSAAATYDARARGGIANATAYHREMRDDRVLTFVEHMPAGMAHYRYLARATTLGRFVVPPTRAECMYDPATFGRTAAMSFDVKAR